MRAYFLPARSMSPVSGFAVILPGIGDTFLHSFRLGRSFFATRVERS
jgi:hypothetical protein